MTTSDAGNRTPPPRPSASAYLDIETSWSRSITIIGVHRPGIGMIQLVAPRLHPDRVLEALDGVTTVCTFNGACFDLPVIREQLGLDLKTLLVHRDLLRDCRRLGLRGGLKRVEQVLGIWRDTEGVDGIQAMGLWERWRRAGDQEALELLLRYNREDCENLEVLERRLATRFGIMPRHADAPGGPSLPAGPAPRHGARKRRTV